MNDVRGIEVGWSEAVKVGHLQVARWRKIGRRKKLKNEEIVN